VCAPARRAMAARGLRPLAPPAAAAPGMRRPAAARRAASAAARKRAGGPPAEYSPYVPPPPLSAEEEAAKAAAQRAAYLDKLRARAGQGDGITYRKLRPKYDMSADLQDELQRVFLGVSALCVPLSLRCKP